MYIYQSIVAENLGPPVQKREVGVGGSIIVETKGEEKGIQDFKDNGRSLSRDARQPQSYPLSLLRLLWLYMPRLYVV